MRLPMVGQRSTGQRQAERCGDLTAQQQDTDILCFRVSDGTYRICSSSLHLVSLSAELSPRSLCIQTPAAASVSTSVSGNTLSFQAQP